MRYDVKRGRSFIITSFMDSFENPAPRWAKEGEVEVYTLSEWAKSIACLVNRRISI